MHFTVSTTRGTLEEDDKVTTAMSCQHSTPIGSLHSLPIAKNAGADRTVFLEET